MRGSDHPSPSPRRGLALALALGLTLIGACASGDRQPMPSPVPMTEIGTATVPFPTLQPTRTSTPEPPATPTFDLLAGLGRTIVFDDFTRDRGWPLGEAASGATSLLDGRLVIAVRQARQFRLAVRRQPSLTSFYAQVEVRTELCSTADEFGIAFRVNSLSEHYRFTLSCEGTARVRRVLLDGSRALALPESTASAFPGAPAVNRLTVWASLDRFRLYVNDDEVFQVRDTALTDGRLGFYVRASRAGQTTVAFDDLLVREILPSASP